MENGGITMIGPFIGEKLDTLPLWQASDEGRVVYSLTTQKYYYGTGSGWKDMSGSGDAFLDADTVDGFHATSDARPNTLCALDANSQLPASADMVDGFHASASPSANRLAVYNSDAKLPASITGDAATLGGNASTAFVRTNANSLIDGYVLTARGSSGQMNVVSGSQGSIEVRAMNGGTEPAMIMLNRQGVYSVFLGLDTDNNLKFGGLSEGTNVYKIWNAKNDGAGSGLDADLLDGYNSSFTAQASCIPILGADGKLASAMIPSTGVPVGTIAIFPVSVGSGLYTDWVSCRGTWLSKTTYATLYAAIGDAYGNGDDSSHQTALGIGTTYTGKFKIPDYRGIFLRMIDAGAGIDPAVNQSAGTENTVRTAHIPGISSTSGLGSIQEDKVAHHSHVFTQNSFADSSGTQTFLGQGRYNSTDSNFGTGVNSQFNAYETRPRNVYVEFAIKYQ